MEIRPYSGPTSGPIIALLTELVRHTLEPQTFVKDIDILPVLSFCFYTRTSRRHYVWNMDLYYLSGGHASLSWPLSFDRRQSHWIFDCLCLLFCRISTRTDASREIAFETSATNHRKSHKKNTTDSCVDHSLPTLDCSPINQFFTSFPAFNYDPSITPSESYGLLQKHQKWPRKSAENLENWERYQSALRKEFDLWYGSEDDLGAWHSLCRAIGIHPLPTTCESCEEVSNFRVVDLPLLNKDTDREKPSCQYDWLDSLGPERR